MSENNETIWWSILTLGQQRNNENAVILPLTLKVRRVDSLPRTPSRLVRTLLISLGSSAAHLPEHHIDDHVAEQKGHAASEPLHSGKLVPGLSSRNREPQIILGELFYNHGGEQVPKEIH